MSVPCWKRSESNVEFLSNFHKLRKEVIQILMRDFGIKKRTYSVHLLEEIYGITQEDATSLESLLEKYGVNSSEIDKYPSWIIDTWRSEIMNILNKIGTEIELANSIYVNNEFEYEERRKHIDLSIGYCNSLKDKLQEIISNIKVSFGAYEIVGELLEKEIRLLKGLRKSDNKVLKKIKASVVQS